LENRGGGGEGKLKKGGCLVLALHIHANFR
jgi:hypothetical protein